MLLARPVALLLISLLMSSPAVIADAGPEPFAPARAVADEAEAGTIVAWTPGIEEADEYRVYGVSGATMVLLGSTDSFALYTPEAYTLYAVTGVKDGIESRPTYAASSECVIRVEWDTTPPTIIWFGDCPWAHPLPRTMIRLGDHLP